MQQLAGTEWAFPYVGWLMLYSLLILVIMFAIIKFGEWIYGRRTDKGT